MPPVPGGTAIGVEYVNAPVAVTLNDPGVTIAGALAALTNSGDSKKVMTAQQKTAKMLVFAVGVVRLVRDATLLAARL